MKDINYHLSMAIFALRVAAEEAYQRDMLDTGMEKYTVGVGKEYESKEDWIAEKMDEWRAEAERRATA